MQVSQWLVEGQRAHGLDGAMREDVPFVLTSVLTGDRTIGLPAADDQRRRNLRIVLAGLRDTG